MQTARVSFSHAMEAMTCHQNSHAINQLNLFGLLKQNEVMIS
jgi:hypothetical protein